MGGRLNSDHCKIVPKSSATLDGYTPISIRADHMNMTKFSSDQDPDYRNVLSELRRLGEPTCSNPSESAQKKVNKDDPNHSQACLAGDQDHAVAHAEVSPNQAAKTTNTFSGTFNTGGGTMIQGGEFNSGGGSMTF